MVKKRFHDVVNNTCKVYGAKSIIKFNKGYPATINHKKQSQFAYNIAKKVNGKTVKVLQVNCDENTKLAEKHGVKGYPTIKTFHNGKEEDYSGGRDLASISDHIESIAGN